MRGTDKFGHLYLPCYNVGINHSVIAAHQLLHRRCVVVPFKSSQASSCCLKYLRTSAPPAMRSVVPVMCSIRLSHDVHALIRLLGMVIAVQYNRSYYLCKRCVVLL
jgi:hypothetical protein